MAKQNEANLNVGSKVSTIMKDNLLWEYYGFEMDGQGELFLSQMREYLDEMLLEAYKIGYLKNEKTKEIIEAKHIKFLGNELLNEMKDLAILLVNMAVKK